ncbi:hypothetical protein DW524_08635 [Escherichia coli]|nr:hypothetical protein [Escherichia coli]EFO2000417.1 hypothetical protein [Escherichia coli]EFO3339335.1 hypothetical protein [Escherichia coli]
MLVDVCYASKRPLVLTVPRALSRIHRITKFTLKRVAEQSRSRTDATKDYTWVLWRGCHLIVWST